jgi:anti-sigma B factor antagonist
VGCMDRTVCVKVRGRATFQNSAGLKRFVREMIQRGYRDFVVDLGSCELMDSTFMGTLAGAALRLREIRHGGLDVVNANERNRSLLCGLGLDQLFNVFTDSGPHTLPQADQAMESEAASKAQQTESVLEAHEALARADSANAVRFRDVIDFLRQELGSGEESQEN